MKIVFQLFILFFKIGFLTIGGGYAMIPVIQVEVVDKRKWIDSADFIDMLSIAQSSPGPIAVNTAIFVGYTKARFLGVISSVLGTILPSIIIILTIAIFFNTALENEIILKAFKAVRPATIGIIIGSAFKMLNTLDKSISKILLSISIGVILTLFNIQPILIIVLSMLISIIIIKLKNRGQQNGEQT